jgi:hypothetical protein
MEGAPVAYDEEYTMQHGMDVTINDQFNTVLNPYRGRACAEVEPTTFKQEADDNSMGLYGDMIETFAQNGGADAETQFDFDFLMLVVFVIAVFYALYLVFSCNTTFIGVFFELLYALMLPFVYIPYTFFVKGCPEFIWKSLGNLVGPLWNQIIAIIASFVMTMGTSVHVWLIGTIMTLVALALERSNAEDEEKDNNTTTATTTATTNTSSPQTPATKVANVTSAASTGIKNTASAVAA